jgi:hypothetical protein
MVVNGIVMALLDHENSLPGFSGLSFMLEKT